MNALLYIIAIVLIIGWAIGFFFTSVGSLIHVFLVIAIISLLGASLIKRPTTVH